MLNPDSWKAHAAGLEPGRSRRYNHDCGEGRTLLVTREAGKYSAWCFRCNDGGKLDGPQETITEKLARLTKVNEAEARMGTAALPEPRTYTVAEWPVEARLWFYKAGLSSHDIGRMRAYYHLPSQRVVLPVLVGSEVVFWQARALDKNHFPKYMAPVVDKGAIIPKWGKGERITLVEDLLSAYKVGLEGEAWCLMGTSLSPAVLALLMKLKRPVNVWLDNDIGPAHLTNRGQIAARKVGKQIRAAGLEVRNIVSMVDPKLMPRIDIKELIL